MSEVNIILTDKEDGTLGVRIVADQEEGKAMTVAMLFMNWLKEIDKPAIITGEK
jgi:hypothetical protein